jgi:hypothetical protein
VTLSVLATGNHYVFDVAAGLLVTAAGFAAGRLTDRLSSSPFGARGQSGLAPATRSYS